MEQNLGDEHNKSATLASQLQQKVATAEDLLRQMTAKAEDVGRQHQEMDQILSDLRETAADLASQPQQKTAEVEDLRRRCEEAERTIADERRIATTFCANLTGIELTPHKWLETLQAAQDLTPLSREPVPRAIWKIYQNPGLEQCSPVARGPLLLCLHLAAVLNAGIWDNRALALMSLLADELADGPVPISSLLLVLETVTAGVRDNSDNILLLLAWQTAKLLENAFPQESRFEAQCMRLRDELMKHSSWCIDLTLAIDADTIPAYCEDWEEGKFYEDFGIGLLRSPRFRECREYFIFDISRRVIWACTSAFIRPWFPDEPPYAGLIIPGWPTGEIKVPDLWALTYRND
ncbi:hypothetical protein N656DRAFT_845037 [Canariomyces notabilis]|uniref:Uncharacterized protein n=1 Tax=Canariomyces notabilis TaxID=2074819 RepID=A0AAN6YT66_9PEZI|nr:hypothetical protein N656DRAFT_845037 [Canariomyces arenarius]